MEEVRRHSGFVIGKDTTQGGNVVWKVRVSDSASPFNERKLVVASVHANLELAQGLNVTFAIGSVSSSGNKKEPRAVDVLIHQPEVPRSTGQEEK
jgi:hypothetical protein